MLRDHRARHKNTYRENVVTGMLHHRKNSSANATARYRPSGVERDADSK